MLRDGRRFAQWKTAAGRLKSAPLSADGQGIRVDSAAYSVQWTDENGTTRRRATKCRDYAAAVQLGSEFERRAMQRREGLLDPVQERHATATRTLRPTMPRPMWSICGQPETLRSMSRRSSGTCEQSSQQRASSGSPS